MSKLNFPKRIVLATGWADIGPHHVRMYNSPSKMPGDWDSLRAPDILLGGWYDPTAPRYRLVLERVDKKSKRRNRP